MQTDVGMKRMTREALREFLEQKVIQYNQPGFIENDPVQIPHAYTKRQDVEIAGFFAAVLAWGQRVTIIRKCQELLALMDNAPHDFICHHSDRDLKALVHFKHRTFNTTDTLYFVAALKHLYTQHTSLEAVLMTHPGEATVEQALMRFQQAFFSLPDAPQRTRKHIPTPERKSTCKRLNMYLRWMVRRDNAGVDFGLWQRIDPAQLICPCDVHVDRVARQLKLIRRTATDWQTALELTDNLRKLDPHDPVKYDFALFGLGVEEQWR